VETNVAFLQSILAHEDFATGRIHTRFVDQELRGLLATSAAHPQFITPAAVAAAGGFAGARVDDSADPLALFNHDAQVKSEEVEVPVAVSSAVPVTLEAPVQGAVISVDVAHGDEVRPGQPIATIESLELHHVVRSDRAGTVHAVPTGVGEQVRRGDPIAVIQGAPIDANEETADFESDEDEDQDVDLDRARGDLVELNERRSYLEDDFRAEKIAKRHAKAQRSPRENLDHLLDGTFREYGPLVTAASWQKQEWLRETTQADGLMMGIGHVNGDLFDEDRSRVIAVHYDYMVVAGTQGGRGHYKQDRIYVLAKRYRLPIILFSEGGGGRPGISGGEPAETVDLATASGLREASGVGPGAASVDIAGRGGGGVPIDSYTFTMLPELSGLVPLVGVNSGRCFAGNTVLLACCDVIIAAENSTIGLGGPAMIEGGGLGIYTPEEVGPMSFQVPNGVVDILVKDDEEAVETAKKYISYFQGSISDWCAPDQRMLRQIVPEERSEMYDMRDVIETIADQDSVLEIRKAFGVGIITALIRVEGMPMGLIANNPEHLSGAIDSDASDKAARFLQLCDTFDLPVLSLMDCPGIMVGPEHERQALLRKCGRLFVTGANMTTPIFGVVVRKAYGLGVQAMCGGSSMEPFFTVAWPTAEFAPMTIDGSVRLAFREELEAIDDPEERQRVYERLVGALVDQAKAVNSGGTSYGIDDVIDPADTRAWIAQGLRSVPAVADRSEKKRPNVDTW
jgi:acetyl-CoA carboxylase carboxyltransferase component/biotin carboxyl carrier protein